MFKKTICCCAILISCQFMQACKAPLPNENRFTIACPAYMQSGLDDIIDTFRKQNPTITIQYKLDDLANGNDEKTKLQVEIMAGEGPDLLIGPPELVTDLYKVSKSGAFYDLNDFLLKDTSFQINSDYPQVVMAAGYIDRHQYFLPIEYTTASLLSTAEILTAEGFDYARCTSQSGFIEEAEKYLNSDSNHRLFSNNIGSQLIAFLLPDMVNYQGEDTQVQSTQIKTIFDILKTDYERANKNLDHSNWFQQLSNKKALFTLGSGGKAQLQRTAMLKTIGAPVMLPVYNAANRCMASVSTFAAVTSSSQHKQQAYDFIKLLLSEYQNPPSSDGQRNKALSLSFHPVKRSGEETAMGVINANIGIPVKIFSDEHQSGDSISMTQLDPSDFDRYMETVYSIEEVGFDSPAWSKIQEIFHNYLNGSQSFSACWGAYENYISIYLSE